MKLSSGRKRATKERSGESEEASLTILSVGVFSELMHRVQRTIMSETSV